MDRSQRELAKAALGVLHETAGLVVVGLLLPTAAVVLGCVIWYQQRQAEREQARQVAREDHP